MIEQFNLSLPTDGDGYISQQCPTCTRRFKVHVDDQGDSPLQFCPYCHATSDNAWWTEEQQEYFMGVAMAQTLDPLLDELSDGIAGLNQTGSLLSFSMRSERSEPPPVPVESDRVMPIFVHPCCSLPVKHDESSSRLFCIGCGQEASTAA